MRRGKKSLALMLVVAMVLTSIPVSAAPTRAGSYTNSWFGNFWNNLFNWNWNDSSDDEDDTAVEEPETEVPEEQEVEQELVVVEDATTVENGDLLRASTYVLETVDSGAETEAVATYGLSTAAETADEGTESTNQPVLKYFNTTLYDYDQTTINNATHKVEVNSGKELTEWEGIYYNGGSPDPESYVYGYDENKVEPTYNADGMAEIEDGTYLIINTRNGKAVKNNPDGGDNGQLVEASSWLEGTVWTITSVEGGYYIKTADSYMSIGRVNACAGSETTVTEITKYANGDGIMLKQGEWYLNDYQGIDNTIFVGWNSSTDAGSVYYLYKVEGELGETASLPYASWNWWNKNSGDNNNGQKIYSGLVENTLDANKNIVFTKPDGGIFNDDASVKKIYPGVEMPFLYKDGYYTFDASQNGVYLKADTTQKSTETAEVTIDETGSRVTPRLYFDEGNPQTNGGTYGDGSSTVWMPFNHVTEISSESNCNYFFGMRTTIPFSMTANGRIVETNDESEAIKFSFSGDDDVWVFIDGQLVIDLGGIHNRLNADIDFAGNTVTLSADNAAKTTVNGVEQKVPFGDYNNSFEAVDTDYDGVVDSYITKLFTDAEGVGLISKDRTTFAASDNHELTIFYLERGAGSSNSKIEFNLPVKDTLTVTKDATKSWSVDETGTGGTVTKLTPAEQAIVDNIDFYFTLYRKTEADGAYETVNNTKYYLINSNGQVVSTPSTDANGKFSLRNGQSARFITTEMDDSDGVTYYVKEDPVDGFVEPDYNYGGIAANGFIVNDDTDNVLASGDLIEEKECFDGDTTSDKVTVIGGLESQDSLVLICSNFMDANLPNPSARPKDDRIVIDYGLPVEIDVLANDLYRGAEIELISVTGSGLTVDDETGSILTTGNAPVYGTASVETNGKIKYTLNKQLTGVEVLSYIVKVSDSAENVAGVNVDTEYAVANVYIIPATSMYYEEDFNTMITYTQGASAEVWSTEGTAQTDCQEPGVVGTIGDSPYGSDSAYLTDSADSNGSSMYVNTANGYAQFEYEFTGTGTSFFARTSANSAYIRVIVTDSAGSIVQDLRRNTIYKSIEGTDVGTLYNVPVYTVDGLEYDTYSVKVEVMKALPALGRGAEFYLDGIRVVNPLNSEDALATDALAAYATDAEAHNKVATLRQKLLGDSQINDDGTLNLDGENFVVFTDSNGQITSVEEYRSNGPKEEVYLNNGQSITFSLKNWDSEADKIYLGAKAPLGSGSITINGRSINLSNAADCYYDISIYAQVTTGEDGVKIATFTIQSVDSLISLTNIKVTGDPTFVIVENANGDNDNSGDENIDGDENTEEDIVVEEDEA